MFQTVRKILKYRIQTQDYPKRRPQDALFLGLPEVTEETCQRCDLCISRCPSKAICKHEESGFPKVDAGTCIFCGLCEEVCAFGAIKQGNQYELSYEETCEAIQKKIQTMFGRSLKIREVDAGSCNGCDYEINALNNPFNDIERLGIRFVASPRHADMLLVTGTATRNMEEALRKTYEATPNPKLVIAVGACACSGGIFQDSYATQNGISSIVPVDVFIPGCPPRPQAIMHGILTALDRLPK